MRDRRLQAKKVLSFFSEGVRVRVPATKRVPACVVHARCEECLLFCATVPCWVRVECCHGWGRVVMSERHAVLNPCTHGHNRWVGMGQGRRGKGGKQRQAWQLQCLHTRRARRERGIKGTGGKKRGKNFRVVVGKAKEGEVCISEDGEMVVVGR